MLMKDAEIKLRFERNKGDSASSAYKYCKILGELNCTSTNSIIDLLNNMGAEGVPKKRGKNAKEETKVETEKIEEVVTKTNTETEDFEKRKKLIEHIDIVNTDIALASAILDLMMVAGEEIKHGTANETADMALGMLKDAKKQIDGLFVELMEVIK